MGNKMVDMNIHNVQFQLLEEHDFRWLKQIGRVFKVFDQQDSGNISFGVEKGNQKLFVKYAGAKPLEFSGDPRLAIERLKRAVPVYQDLSHPHVIKMLDHFSTDDGFAIIFEWFDGECLHPHWQYGGAAKYTNPNSPFFRFRQLDVEKRLNVMDVIFSFHTYVESQGYVAVDFYDGSLLYDFKNDEMKICDIDFYRKSPTSNDLGKDFWGSRRFKSPEEYQLAAPIDSVTNVFNLGAIAFGLFGGELDRSYSKWDAGIKLYEVALKAVEEKRENRYQSIKDFYNAWNEALKE